ncbi:MAG: hypothetical protein NTV00_16585 [Methylococcales bacterium]|nr:hypothetical protein [Methylococcales bacterium]
MTRQYMTGQRIGNIETLQKEISAWSINVTNQPHGVNWHMKISDVHTKSNI